MRAKQSMKYVSFFFDVRSAGTGTYVLNDIYVLCTYYILYSYMLEF